MLEVKKKSRRFLPLSKKYYDARHVCYAYVLGDHGDRTRQNDDGEPSGTAGAPLGRQLRSYGLTYTLLIVVRYFGGVKLGTSRLGVAYKAAAIEALENAEKKSASSSSALRSQ